MSVEKARPAESTAQTVRPKRDWRSSRPISIHFRAAAVAAMLAIGLLCVSVKYSHRLAKRAIHARGWEYSIKKNQGIAWQKAAFAEPDLLPLYGSSELIKPAAGEAYLFFQEHPSGFVVSPAGRGGCTSLNLLQKIASAGQDAPHHKLAVCISPSWFFGTEAHGRWYAGNFSAQQAYGLIFSRRISLGLKRDIARRMLDYPETIGQSPLLSFAVHRLAGSTGADLALFHASEPVGWIRNALTEAREDMDLAWDVLCHDRGRSSPTPGAAPLDWPNLLAAGALQARANPHDKPEQSTPPFTDSALVNYAMFRTREWTDLELLLRVSRELELDSLFMAIPMDCRYLERMGVSRLSIDAYTQRLRLLSKRYGVELVDFADHGNDDPYFFSDHRDHPSVRGWLFMDEAMDHFFRASPASRIQE
jgi:D-alanine transfer protein